MIPESLPYPLPYIKGFGSRLTAVIPRPLQLAAKDCKRECERDFVNKAEYCRMVGTQDRFESELSHRIDEFRSSMDKKLESVHGRITDCATQIARIQGEASGKENLQ